MKAILVIDEMPKSCCDCHYNQYLEYVGYRYCVADVNNLKVLESEFDDEHDLYDSRKSWCPLKPMPQKKEVEVNKIEDIMHTEYSIEDIYKNKYVADIQLATDKLISLGWNACINEILGEEE